MIFSVPYSHHMPCYYVSGYVYTLRLIGSIYGEDAMVSSLQEWQLRAHSAPYSSLPNMHLNQKSGCTVPLDVLTRNKTIIKSTSDLRKQARIRPGGDGHLNMQVKAFKGLCCNSANVRSFTIQISAFLFAYILNFPVVFQCCVFARTFLQDII